MVLVCPENCIYNEKWSCTKKEGELCPHHANELGTKTIGAINTSTEYNYLAVCSCATTGRFGIEKREFVNFGVCTNVKIGSIERIREIEEKCEKQMGYDTVIMINLVELDRKETK